MITETMTIHQALTELKTLDKRITDKISYGLFVTYNKHCNSKINGKPVRETENDIKSAFESVTDLIARRGAIRAALAKSNSETPITVAGKTYTVSTAIEAKQHGVELKYRLMDEINRQLSAARAAVDRGNGDRLSESADDYVTRLYGSKDKSNADDIAAAREQYIKANTIDLIDPLNAASKIDELRTEIEDFMTAIDSAISVSNALTYITITY